MTTAAPCVSMHVTCGSGPPMRRSLFSPQNEPTSKVALGSSSSTCAPHGRLSQAPCRPTTFPPPYGRAQMFQKYSVPCADHFGLKRMSRIVSSTSVLPHNGPSSEDNSWHSNHSGSGERLLATSVSAAGVECAKRDRLSPEARGHNQPRLRYRRSRSRTGRCRDEHPRPDFSWSPLAPTALAIGT